MKRLTTAFFMAWGMFCAIPCPYQRWDERLRPLMLVCFPLLGMLLGGIWCSAAWLIARWGGLGLFGPALLAALPCLLTGFLHLDGFMDCCDAILSRRPLEERQRILKDSHVGAFAVICVDLLLLLSVALFATAEWSKVWRPLLFLPAAARGPAALAVLSLSPMGGSSYAGGFQAQVGRIHRLTADALTVIFPVLSAALFGIPGLCAAAAACGSALALRCGVRQLGGMSGDISGFAVTVGEFCGVAALTFLGKQVWAWTW